ncbi:MAG: glycosyltransferase family 4 protein, partial [Thermoleophilaceae bacterium]
MIRALARRVAHPLGLMRGKDRFETFAALAREGPAPLRPDPELARRQGLRIAVLVPPFQRGSGGLSTILALIERLAARGHRCSMWLEDPRRRMPEPRRRVEKRLRDYFGPIRAEVHSGFSAWAGADVVVATGWETVPRALLLPGCAGRAYLVQDYEPDFFPASAEARWAEETYSQGLFHITAGPWLAELLRERFGARAGWFALGVDHEVYRPLEVARREDTVILYARRSTPRRAVPLALLGLAELHRRRNDLRLVLFGEEHPMRTSFPYHHAGIRPEPELARLYAEATVGVSLSLTNYSRVSQEMLACGLPCVELDTPSVRAALGGEEGVTLVPFDPLGLADAVERLLDDPKLRARRGEAGRVLVAERTWDRAADQFERCLREALAGAPGVP